MGADQKFSQLKARPMIPSLQVNISTAELRTAIGTRNTPAANSNNTRGSTTEINSNNNSVAQIRERNREKHLRETKPLKSPRKVISAKVKHKLERLELQLSNKHN